MTNATCLQTFANNETRLKQVVTMACSQNLGFQNLAAGKSKNTFRCMSRFDIERGPTRLCDDPVADTTFEEIADSRDEVVTKTFLSTFWHILRPDFIVRLPKRRKKEFLRGRCDQGVSRNNTPLHLPISECSTERREEPSATKIGPDQRQWTQYL